MLDVIRGAMIGGILLLLALFLSQTVFADTLPAYMKDGMIEVTLQDGAVYSYSLNDYMVVPRRGKPKAVVDVAAAPESGGPKTPWAVKGYVGYGLMGYGVKMTSYGAKVKDKYDVNYGLGVEYNVNKRVFIDGIMVLNPELSGGLLGAGYRF